VSFRIGANTGGDRNATLTIAAQTVTVSQTAPPPPPACTVTLSSPSSSFGSAGGSGSVGVTADPSCTWSATSSDAWITITAGTGTGNGVVSFNAAANDGVTRSGTIAILNQTFTVSEAGAAPAPGATDVILHPSAAPIVAGNWRVNTDPTAADGASLLNPDNVAAKIGTALAAPADYFEMTFDAVANTPYRLWVRGKATGDTWMNDSIYVQFDNSVASDGVTPLYQFGTTNALVWSLEDCSGCGVAGWGWQDAGGYGSGVAGPLVYFRTTGTQRIRIQVREDGLAIDQIVFSPQRYLSASPGLAKNDSTFVQ
jgi:Viral BACON domain/Putative binding domain, N-terminal